jgi:hypothetical protein
MADQDRLDATIKVLDEVSSQLSTVQRFLEDKLTTKLSADIAGPILDVPQKVAGLGPVLFDKVFGQGPGDEPYDTLRDLQQAFDTDPPGVPGTPGQEHVIIDRVGIEDAGPEAPEADRVRTGVFDP